jgi:hypothetical protein
MKRIIMVSIFSFVLLFAFGVSITDAVAKTVKYKITSYIVKAEHILVPDTEKHAIGIYERRGVAIYENGETAAYHSRGTFDFVKGSGPFQGYTNLKYKDGSTTIIKYQGKMTMNPSSKSRTLTGKGEYIKGTGRFEGIKGNVSFSGKYITPYTADKTKGDTVFDNTATYSISK